MGDCLSLISSYLQKRGELGKAKSHPRILLDGEAIPLPPSCVASRHLFLPKQFVTLQFSSKGHTKS